MLKEEMKRKDVGITCCSGYHVLFKEGIQYLARF